MKIKYTIYWFENDLARLNRKETIDGINNIKKLLINKGFFPEMIFYINKKEIPTRFSNVKKLDTILLDDYTTTHLNTIDFSNVDLVVMDYNLGTEEESGDKIISYIRSEESDIFTDILFYSENGSETELRGIADRDGLYCSNWNEVFSGGKISKVLTTLIRKTQDFNNLRGLVMAETSEIDNLMKEILIKAITKYNFTFVDNTSQYSKVDKKFICTNPASVNFSLRKKDDEIITINKATSFHTLKALKIILNSSLITTRITTSQLDDYRDDLKRNILAHSFEISNNNIQVVLKDFNGNTHTFQETDFEEIRKNLRTYKGYFEEIKNSL